MAVNKIKPLAAAKEPTVMLSLEEDKEWLKFLKSNDYTQVSQILQNCSPEERGRLISGKFKDEKTASKIKLHATYPWNIAAIHGSTKVLEVLYSYDINIWGSEKDDDNVLHLLAAKNWVDKDKEEMVVKTYESLKKILSKKEHDALLMQKNSAGFRPLEWALLHNAFHLAEKMLNSPNVYLVKQQNEGASVCRWYDITVYEANFGKKNKLFSHLLYAALNLKNTHLEDEATRRYFASGFLKVYLSKKLKLNILFYCIWIIYRLGLIICVFLYALFGPWSGCDQIRDGGTNSTFEKTCYDAPPISYAAVGPCILLLCGCSLLHSMVDFFRPTLPRMCMSKSSWVDDNVELKTVGPVNLFSIISIFVIFLNELFIHVANRRLLSTSLEDILFIGGTLQYAISLVFFLQISKTYGWFPILIKRLEEKASNFLLCSIYFTITFALLNLRYSLEYPEMGDGQFDSYMLSVYSSMVMLFTGANYKAYKPLQIFPFGILQMFVVFTSIISLNFLIALFSDTVSHVMSNREVISTIQKISVLADTERLFRSIPFVDRLYERLNLKVFDKMDGKLVIKTSTYK